MHSGYYGSKRTVKRFKPKKTEYKNPYFRKTSVKKNKRTYYGFFGAIIAVAAWIYFLFFSSIFVISDLDINGLKIYQKEAVISELRQFLAKKNFFIFSNSNIFLFNGKDLMEALAHKFAFQDVSIKKYYPGKLSIAVEEKETKAAIYNGNKIYVVAGDGTVVLKLDGVQWGPTANPAATGTAEYSISKETLANILSDAKNKPLPLYPIFCDAWMNNNLSIGDLYFDKTQIQVLKNIYAFVDNTQEKTGLRISAVTIEKNLADPKIVIYTQNGWPIYISSREDGLKQFKKLEAALNSESDNPLKDMTKKLEYIDLRFGDRVYIK
jgi:cell division septal protein FtsQ